MSNTKKHPYKIPFYHSISAPCPYLPEKTERKLFTELDQNNPELLDLLTRAGFRRSHDVLYRPDCESCKACIPSRINIMNFNSNKKSIKRWLNKNQTLSLKFDNDINKDEAYALFQNYQNTRHSQSEMRHMSRADFIMMFFEPFPHSKLIGYYDDKNTLIASLLYDITADGASAIYSFFNPLKNNRSLGKFMIYHLAKTLKDHHQKYLYLGYWIKENPEMSYKGHFEALEILTESGWTPSLL